MPETGGAYAGHFFELSGQMCRAAVMHHPGNFIQGIRAVKHQRFNSLYFLEYRKLLNTNALRLRKAAA